MNVVERMLSECRGVHAIVVARMFFTRVKALGVLEY